MKEINMGKAYNHSDVEDRLYSEWEKKGYFDTAPNKDKKPFTIVIPPPNITGMLHMGHALDVTVQDSIIRYYRMKGYEALWLPGLDHASIATELKIVEKMAAEGLTKQDISREDFLKRAWDWKKEYGGIIINQLKKLGASCDWNRERFTMDEGCNKAVVKVFVSLYRKGLIYRGDRVINWCTECKTALSDAEVEYEEQNSSLWHVRYDAPDKSYSIVCATTRPETILGDTGIAVNPEDERYSDLVGKKVIIPVIGREIPIVSDPYVEMDFGTGAVKITPAHDPNDFEVASRAGLPSMRVFTDDGYINELGGKYKGMDRMECRKVFVEELRAFGALEKIAPYAHNVGTCYRCHTTVEPLISKQWFVKMKPLAEPAIKAVEDGEIKFVPERFDKTYFNWMRGIRDWCISRQLWWGHRIPAYYCDKCGEMLISEETPSSCPKCSENMRQDEDVLDTWFSSGLWPFSTLGWPEKTDALDYFYPTSTLVTGYDIIFFWVARMIVFGYEVMGERPFDTVYIHGILRDEHGKKMSKSAGNGIDPLEMVKRYGADALRFSLVTGNSAGNDMRVYDKKIEAAANFCNKVYNASRFVLMNIGGEETKDIDLRKADIADKWILARLNQITAEVTQHMDDYDLNLAAQKIFDFIWTEFCDWYIEMAKPKLNSGDAEEEANTKAVLVKVMTDSMKLLHPFMPFITDEIYNNLPKTSGSIMVSDWAKCDKAYENARYVEAMERIMELIRAIRNIRAEMNVPPSRKTSITVVVKEEDEEICVEASKYIARLCGGENIIVQTGKEGIQKDAVSVVTKFAEAYMPFEQLVDLKQERERLAKEIAFVESEVKRAEGKLNNSGFVDKAPPEVVEAEREKLKSNSEMLIKLKEKLLSLQ